MPLTLCLHKQTNKPTILMYLRLLSFVHIAFRQTRRVNVTKMIHIWMQTVWCSSTPYQFSVMQASSRVSKAFSCSVLKSCVLLCLQRATPCIQIISAKQWTTYICLAAPGVDDHVCTSKALLARPHITLRKSALVALGTRKDLNL